MAWLRGNTAARQTARHWSRSDPPVARCPAGCTRINYWSNPGKTYGGVPMGTTTKHHNQRVLQNTKATIAAFR